MGRALFFFKMWPLVGIPCSNGCSHTHVDKDGTGWTEWVIKMEITHEVQMSAVLRSRFRI